MLIQLAKPIPSAAPPRDLIARAEAVATVAAAYADEVDALGRFPREAVSALKAERLLGAMVPVALGGEGATVAELAEVCHRLAQACASTAMIFAMHQIKAACVVNHSHGAGWHADFLREVAISQLLLASSTTEGQGGGDVRSSQSAIERDGATIRFERAAAVMSYGAQADAVVTTARRAPDAAPSDQVLVVFRAADYRLTETGTWETLGMRGTRSAGFALQAQGHELQVLAQPYAEIHAQTMTPVAHLLWSSVWAGIAAASVERARLFLRKAARSGQTPPAAAHFNRASGHLRALRALIAGAMERYEAVRHDPRRPGRAGLPDGHHPAQGRGVGAGPGRGDERHAHLRSFRLSQRWRGQPGPGGARHPLRPDHDQQRPHPRQPRRRGGDGRDPPQPLRLIAPPR